jgi:hypothetical protein
MRVLGSLAYHDYEGVVLDETRRRAWFATWATSAS